MESAKENRSEPNLNALWDGLRCLLKPASENTEDFKDLRGAFQLNLRKAASALGFENVEIIPRQGSISSCGQDTTWTFVETAVYILMRLKEVVKNDDLSVSHQKDIRSCLQFVVSLGIRPHILPGVILEASGASSVLNMYEGDSTVMQKYERLCIVVKSLVSFFDSSTFRSLIVSNILSQLLGALLQLSFAPIKKPPDSCTHSALDENLNMTVKLWDRLQKDREYFRTCLDQIVKETYQPKIMVELMIIQANQKDVIRPLWLRKSSSKLLTHCLIQPGGVAALIRATFDSTLDTGSDWKKIETLATIIVSPVNHYSNIAAQLLQLIEVAGKEASDMQHIVVACIKRFYDIDAVNCYKMLIEPLLQPLFQISKLTKNESLFMNENEIDLVVKQIYLCFALPTSSASSTNLPGTILLPLSCFFFQLFCKVSGSVSVLSKYCEDIICCIFCDSCPKDIEKILMCILLGEKEDGMLTLPANICFGFGPNGGVVLEISSEPEKDLLSSSIEDSGDKLMLLMEKRNDDSMFVSVFEVLLKMLVDLGMKPNKVIPDSLRLETLEDTLASLMLASEKPLGIVRLLAALLENDSVKNNLSKSPDTILKFIISLLNSFAKDDCLNENCENEDLECVFVAFMILNVILDNCKEGTDWSKFETLLKPVKMIEDKTRNEELKRLAIRVHTIISSCGAVEDCVPKEHVKCQKTKCEEAMHDACDPLLPVRGHALVQLSKLLQQQDLETLAKKEAVLCVFRENLNNSDSFVYLAAINGMVAFAGIQPDEVVTSLTQEYVETSSAGKSSCRDPEIRMKVGEILVKLVRTLGPMAIKYRNELLNAFLVGAKDVDHLIRASSLSNLGEVCQALGFRVGPILRELLLCIQSTLRFDKALEPRRASVMVVTHLLRGLDADTLSVLHDATLELYRSLKHAYCNDEDYVVRLHAQLALEELGRIAQDILFPKLPFEKKIRVVL